MRAFGREGNCDLSSPSASEIFDRIARVNAENSNPSVIVTSIAVKPHLHLKMQHGSSVM